MVVEVNLILHTFMDTNVLVQTQMIRMQMTLLPVFFKRLEDMVCVEADSIKLHWHFVIFVFFKQEIMNVL